jgi:hypothetical protein
MRKYYKLTETGEGNSEPTRGTGRFYQNMQSLVNQTNLEF